MSKTTEALKLAEEALVDNIVGRSGRTPKTHEAIASIREALAEQKPKKWIDLTSEEYETICQGNMPLNIRVRMVAMALKGKNFWSES